ncbi:MAG: hypothetical protein KGN00_06435 [Chloroflexota bacterium]|nr:hypothetical protein [Chloroflexota bacterium]MDE3193307.1 hypothetical protein [Chloroflexota bacterium]
MKREVVLRLGATAATVLAVLGSVGYVAAHPKYTDAPLQPPVVRPAPTFAPIPSGGRLQIRPAVRATELPAVTGTHVS